MEPKHGPVLRSSPDHHPACLHRKSCPQVTRSLQGGTQSWQTKQESPQVPRRPPQAGIPPLPRPSAFLQHQREECRVVCPQAGPTCHGSAPGTSSLFLPTSPLLGLSPSSSFRHHWFPNAKTGPKS